ncbi:MAG: hypothetical protein AAB541_00415, partial [Patescibacteria group bacterium]
YYEVNQKYEHYKPLAAIFGGVSFAPPEPATEETKADKKPLSAKPRVDVPTTEHPLAKGLRATGHVELALLSGQFTRDESAGIDVLIVGDVNQAKAAKFISDLEASENKELRYTVISLDNYHYRLQINDRFINNVLGAKKQVIINTQELQI